MLLSLLSLLNMIRWGIIGVGEVCREKSGPAFGELCDSTLINICRRNPTQVENFKILLKSKRCTINVDELLMDEQVNAVYVATPPSSHKKFACKAISANKHVYIEKPIGLSAKEGRDIKDALEQQNQANEEKGNGDEIGELKASVAHYRRALPAFLRVKEDIKDETVGLEFINELRPVTFRWKKAKDVPSEMKAHSDSEERVMNGKYNHGFIAQEVKSVIDKKFGVNRL